MLSRTQSTCKLITVLASQVVQRTSQTQAALPSARTSRVSSVCETCASIMLAAALTLVHTRAAGLSSPPLPCLPPPGCRVGVRVRVRVRA